MWIKCLLCRADGTQEIVEREAPEDYLSAFAAAAAAGGEEHEGSDE